MITFFGIALILAGVTLTRIGSPDAAGVSPRLLRGFFGEHVYPIVCTGCIVLGAAALLASVMQTA